METVPLVEVDDEKIKSERKVSFIYWYISCMSNQADSALKSEWVLKIVCMIN